MNIKRWFNENQYQITDGILGIATFISIVLMCSIVAWFTWKIINV